MDAKQKAYELVSKFEKSLFGYDVAFDDDWVKCINCSLIAVDELIELSSVLNKWDMLYYKEVKKEIEKL
jgi:hypothetical protein